MTHPTSDLLAECAMSLSASTASSTGEPRAVFYVASARVAFEKVKAQLASLERLLIARERELCAEVGRGRAAFPADAPERVTRHVGPSEMNRAPSEARGSDAP